MSLGTLVKKPIVSTVLAAVFLTAAWAVLRDQAATPQGLVRTVSDGAQSAEPLRLDTTATVDLEDLKRETDLPSAFRVRWEGYWFVPEALPMTLEAQGDARVNLYVDGKLVATHDAAADTEPARAGITLGAGPHQLVVDYDNAGVGGALSIQWAPRGSQLRSLPSDDLFVQRLNRRDYDESRAIGWLGWLALVTWLGAPLLVAMPTLTRHLATLKAGEGRRRVRALTFPVLLGPLQILLFGTHTVYLGNTDEFSASFWTLSVQWLPLLVAAVAGLMAVGFILSEHWFERYVVALFGVGLLAWLQGGVLLANYGAFTGEGVEWDLHAWRSPYETALWLMLPILMIVAARKLFSVAPFASQLLVGLQVLVLVGSAFQARSDDPTAYSNRRDFAFELSPTQNVIHIVLDAFQSDVFQEILESDAEVVDSLSGFVFFTDHAGAFRTTIASIPAMLTGEVYRNQNPLNPFIEGLAAEQSLFSVLQRHGFDTDAVSIHGRGLGAATNAFRIPKPYVSADEYAKFAAWQLADLSLFRHVPHSLKPWVYNDEYWRLQDRFGRTDGGASTRRRHHAENGRAFLDDFVSRVHLGRGRPVYKFLHVGIPHLPLVLNADCEFIGLNRSTRAGYVDQSTCATRLMTRLFDRLRALGVYDSSVIVLSSDHGANFPPNDFVDDDPLPFANMRRLAGNARALLAVKPVNAAGPLRMSDLPTTITDIPATVVDLTGITDTAFPGTSVFQLDHESARERTYAWYEWKDADWKRDYLRHLDVYSLSGRLSDRGSWTYAGAIFEPGTELEDVSQGWGRSTTDGQSRRQRLIDERVTFYAPPESRGMTLDIRSTAPSPQVMTVTVLINGKVVDRLALDNDGWRTIEYDLPPARDMVAARVDLQVAPPARLRADTERDLGVVARDVQWRR